MQVKIETVCERCGKKEEKTVDLAVAQSLEETAKNRQTAAAELTNFLNGQLTAEHPNVIVLFRNDSKEQYAIKFLDNLCSMPDAKRNKGCLSRVQTLINDIFAPTSDKPKKPRAKKAAPPASEPKKDKKPSKE